ncbi:MAG: hypothetical protein KAR17_08650, partial [Cyclobacteriaceae bacterium]|nr:hypothetical protein [Cyclobacteriaceae bacterium]
DGRIAELPKGCQVYFPTLADSWEGNYYNFSVYIRELIEVVEARYNTKTGPQNRAVSGLSMGGHMATWVAATNPHLFSSAAQFCHGPNFYDVGEPTYQTSIDLRELWRNLRGVPFRHSTTNRDYIRFYTDQLYNVYKGAGFENEYFLDDYCHHAATRIDLQADFHLERFSKKKENVRCFSHVNLYPDFEIWGYNISSSKIGNGWIYLNNVTSNGLGIYTRKRLPWGKSLSEFDISVTTPAKYKPNKKYILLRYSYRTNAFTNEEISADDFGRLTISSTGGIGEEIGILGAELQAPVIVLTDTVNENIYLEDNITTPISIEVANLSMSAQTIDFTVSTSNTEILSIVKQPKQVTIPPQSKIRIDSFVTCRGSYLDSLRNIGYIKISSSINGIVQDREQIIQVCIKDKNTQFVPSEFKIFDGNSENLPLFKYDWREWDNPVTSGVIAEGVGNGNGKAEVGETFSIWIIVSEGFDTKDRSTWHPVVPINTNDNKDVSVVEILHHHFNTGRDVLSAQIRLNRFPTKENPIRIPVQTELLKVQYLENDCHRNTSDNFQYSYCELVLKEDGAINLVNENYKNH